MQLVMFTKMLAELDVRELGRTVRDLGFDGLDLAIRPGHPIDPDNVESALPEAIKLWSDMGLVVGMATTDTSLIDPTSDEAKRVFTVCGQAGIPHIKLGYWLWKPGEDYWEGVRRIRGALDGFAELGASCGALPCFHTHSGLFYGSNAAALMHLIQGMDPSRIGAYLDTAHLALDGEPFEMAVEMVRPYLRLIAIKDPIWLDDGGKKIVPLGDGLVDFRDVCRVLREIPYDGTLTLHSEYDLTVDEVVATTRQDMERFRAWLAEADS